MYITFLLIATTVLVSLAAFNNSDLLYKLKHWPYQEARRGEYHRWLTSGFLHGDYMHLLFNMIALYAFGQNVEFWLQVLYPQAGRMLYLLLYLFAIVAASSATYYKHRNNPGFASIGASGAVSAIVFTAILFDPTIPIAFLFIPIPIPGFIFGILYLWYSSYAANRSHDGIDHAAHFYGALFGFCFPLVFQPSLITHFIARMQEWFSSFL